MVLQLEDQSHSVLILQGISMEWGNFRSPHLPITEFDACLDSESLNPGSQVWQIVDGS